MVYFILFFYKNIMIHHIQWYEIIVLDISSLTSDNCFTSLTAQTHRWLLQKALSKARVNSSYLQLSLSEKWFQRIQKETGGSGGILLKRINTYYIYLVYCNKEKECNKNTKMQ